MKYISILQNKNQFFVNDLLATFEVSKKYIEIRTTISPKLSIIDKNWFKKIIAITVAKIGSVNESTDVRVIPINLEPQKNNV